ncbi:WGR domain-containing protein [Rhodococcus sp. HNM0563]|uniref:ATP-dependent DNA ligase n=1 Tax=Rhodococcus sp. HNM0563 TaxID=2716339 RepID=UPI00146B42A5|nr:WGR domain-containing protein [Rhodococcus sp. HNM0563]
MTTTAVTTTAHINEAVYIDPRAGNDKFYRTFTFGSAWVSQYGRNGTLGTFTKIVETASPEAAVKAAAAKFAGKVKKGYEPVRSGGVETSTVITADNLAVLDTLVESLHKGDAVGIVTEPVTAVEMDTRREDFTAAAVEALTATSFLGEPAVAEDTMPSLPVRPMLASVQPAEIVADAMDSDDWYAQFKYDGDRVVIEIDNGEIRVLNRQGQAKVRNVGPSHLHPFSALHSGRWVFDGEVVGRTLVLFDLIVATDGINTWARESMAFPVRHHTLTILTEVLGIPAVDKATEGSPVVLAPVAVTAQHKADMLESAVAEQREGIILRHYCGTYESGRRSTMLVKHKLIKDVDVVVTALHPVKDSAELAVHDAEGNLVQAGTASTIGKGAVEVGQVWVVTFLYVTNPEHPRMVQPRLIRQRHDKALTECLLDQFADAGTNKAV